nr:unnamed protein product [Digitaria exilis]
MARSCGSRTFVPRQNGDNGFGDGRRINRTRRIAPPETVAHGHTQRPKACDRIGPWMGSLDFALHCLEPRKAALRPSPSPPAGPGKKGPFAKYRIAIKAGEAAPWQPTRPRRRQRSSPHTRAILDPTRFQVSYIELGNQIKSSPTTAELPLRLESMAEQDAVFPSASQAPVVVVDSVAR